MCYVRKSCYRLEEERLDDSFWCFVFRLLTFSRDFTHYQKQPPEVFCKAWNFIKKRLQHKRFLCEIYEIFKNTYFEEHLRTTDSTFLANVAILFLLKTPENQRWYQIRTSARNELTTGDNVDDGYELFLQKDWPMIGVRSSFQPGLFPEILVQTSDALCTGFEPAQELSSGFAEWR